MKSEFQSLFVWIFRKMEASESQPSHDLIKEMSVSFGQQAI